MTTAAGATLVEVARSLNKVRDDLLSAERAAQLGHSNLHETHRRSAVNLVHYLALRRRDVRKLQHELARLGLSSLGRCEAHVLASVDQVVRLLETLTSTLGGGQRPMLRSVASPNSTRAEPGSSTTPLQRWARRRRDGPPESW
jgi:pyruvate kinase